MIEDYVNENIVDEITADDVLAELQEGDKLMNYFEANYEKKLGEFDFSGAKDDFGDL